MIQDWIGKFFENRSWLGLMQYNPSSGLITAGGTTFSGLATYTLAEFTDINFDLTIARHVVVSDLPDNETLQGGSLWYIDPTATIKRKLRSEAIYYSTYAAAIAAFPAATWTGLAIRCGNVNSYNCRLKSNGTRYKPESGDVVLFQNSYGTLVTPTKTSGTGATSYIYDVGTPTIPASLLASGDMIDVIALFRKNGANATMTPVTFMGTAGDATDSQGYGTAVSNVDDQDLEMQSRFWINSSTSAIVNQSTEINSGTGISNNLRDRSTKFNTASDMKITLAIGAKHSSDDINLLYYRIVWRAS